MATFVTKNADTSDTPANREMRSPPCGWNWRAYEAYLAGVVPVFPGFLAQAGIESVPIGAQHLYVVQRAVFGGLVDQYEYQDSPQVASMAKDS
ncbi:hypothetical protein K504DRAFT_505940 [Pleomassaria siparia CBS 279.74]|uniref:Uncharacterized protein n=1 Tax=Pleomassaria siparia CBS 279.74 TaxID=1314801 RepID=A0A6G1JYW1_9PLEO|nr:hypothetical protein K504DRAFT_505940 [Pleomassaria siparia CBS 279.74]